MRFTRPHVINALDITGQNLQIIIKVKNLWRVRWGIRFIRFGAWLGRIKIVKFAPVPGDN